LSAVSTEHAHSLSLLSVLALSLVFGLYLDLCWPGRHERLVKALSLGFLVFSLLALRYKGRREELAERLAEQAGCVRAAREAVEGVRAEVLNEGAARWVEAAVVAKVGYEVIANFI